MFKPPLEMPVFLTRCHSGNWPAGNRRVIFFSADSAAVRRSGRTSPSAVNASRTDPVDTDAIETGPRRLALSWTAGAIKCELQQMVYAAELIQSQQEQPTY